MNCLKTHLEIFSPPHAPGGLATVMHSAFVCRQGQEIPLEIIYMKELHVKAWWYPHPSSPSGGIGTKSSLELGFSVLFYYYCYYIIVLKENPH